MGAKIDIELASLAAKQRGVVSRVQLLRLGFSRKEIERRVAAGRLHRIHRGVYAVGHTALSREGRLMAAVLACGEGAVLSHATAASVWNLRPTSQSKIDVSIPSSAGRRGPRVIRLHRRPGLTATDVTWKDTLPITTVARTLLDVATVVSPQALARALEQAEKLDLLDATPIHALLAHERGRPGAPALTRAMATYGPEPTRSDLEADFVAFCDEHHIARPSINTWLEGFEVDAHWGRTSLVAELDSRRHHTTTAAFERDRERDATLIAAGYTVMRITARRLASEPQTLADQIRRALSARSDGGTAQRSAGTRSSPAPP